MMFVNAVTGHMAGKNLGTGSIWAMPVVSNLGVAYSGRPKVIKVNNRSAEYAIDATFVLSN